jgi:hypothetical protein
MTVDPGPPPEPGLVVRPTEHGFHARIWPRPAVPWLRFAAVFGGSGSVGLVLGVVTGLAPGALATAAVSLGGFGLGLAVVAWLPGFAPLELDVDEHIVYWNGERYPWARVRGARATGSTLVLLDSAGEAIDRFHHLREPVAAWLALALQASLPDQSPLPS